MAAARFHGWVVLMTVSGLLGCSQHFSEPYKLAGNKQIEVKALNNGHEAFMLYCYGCHGRDGDGKGPASVGMRPPPRNFKQGLFKFAGVAAGQLPVDDALERTIRRGLQGTPMFPWDITDPERKEIVQYLKTISPRWKEEEPGAAIEISADPWTGKDKEAIELGKAVYHVSAAGYAGCSGCHASYATRQEISEMTKKATGEAVADFNPEMYRTSLRETEYALTTDEKGESTKNVQQLPPDFLYHKVKTAYPVGSMVDGKVYTAAEQRTDLYRTIGAGIGGAAMPQWKGSLPEENLWALVYYVQTLIAERGTDQAFALRASLESQPAWTSPVPTEPKPDEDKEQAPAKNGGQL